ncbi:TPA: hypothetical protein HMU14_23305 [Escherichia coli]|nr:hypothetical protein [Escherichia coli]
MKPEGARQLAWLDAQHESPARRERQRSPAQKKGATPLQVERGIYPRAIINSIQLLSSPAVHRIF